MPGFLSKTLAAAGVLCATALGSPAGQSGQGIVEDHAALAADDQCATGDEQCALNALQLRSGEARRRHGAQSDITVDTEKELLGDISFLQRNTTAMRWKVYYMNWDYKSAYLLIHHKRNPSPGVNGTRVDWTAHPATWFPTNFSRPPSAVAPASNASATSEPSTSEVANLLQHMSSRRRRGQVNYANLPPRYRAVQQTMDKQQKLLDDTWKRMTKMERSMNTLGNYLHARGGLVQSKAAEEAHETSGRRRRRAEATAEAAKPFNPVEAKELVMGRLSSAWNQTEEIWGYMDNLGDQLESLKMRADEFAEDDEP